MNTSTPQIFNITATAVNDAPTVAAPLADQGATVGTAFGYTVPASSFADVDAGDTLTYVATLADGGALPAWLAFDPGGRSFSGTPSDLGMTIVRVTANDGHGGSVFDDFVLTVGASVINGMLGDHTPDPYTYADIINGLGGNDTLVGNAGDDVLAAARVATFGGVRGRGYLCVLAGDGVGNTASIAAGDRV